MIHTKKKGVKQEKQKKKYVPQNFLGYIIMNYYVSERANGGRLPLTGTPNFGK